YTVSDISRRYIDKCSKSTKRKSHFEPEFEQPRDPMDVCIAAMLQHCKFMKSL
uniref:Uncharacterized protein n=1 Tax=Ciona intestinalis TaxID=7719 RepID=H2XNC9_CIOIN